MPTGDRGQITSLAPWFGGKRTIGPEIVRQLGPHSAYCEPFCGSMAVLFAKAVVKHEIVNDLHGDIVNVAWVLQRRRLKARLLVALHDTLCSEAQFRVSRTKLQEPFAADPDAPDWRRAYHALVTWWVGRSGIAGTRLSRTSFAARFTSRGGSGGVRFRNMVECLPAFAARLARVDVLNRDGFEVLGKLDDRLKTAVYIDPPYLVKNGEYIHDFVEDDHRRLAEALGRFRHARVVVSYYPDPRLEELYPSDRWHRVELDVNKQIMNSSTARRDGATRTTELLLINGPPIAYFAGYFNVGGLFEG